MAIACVCDGCNMKQLDSPQGIKKVPMTFHLISGRHFCSVCYPQKVGFFARISNFWYFFKFRNLIGRGFIKIGGMFTYCDKQHYCEMENKINSVYKKIHDSIIDFGIWIAGNKQFKHY